MSACHKIGARQVAHRHSPYRLFSGQVGCLNGWLVTPADFDQWIVDYVGACCHRHLVVWMAAFLLAGFTTRPSASGPDAVTRVLDHFGHSLEQYVRAPPLSRHPSRKSHHLPSCNPRPVPHILRSGPEPARASARYHPQRLLTCTNITGTSLPYGSHTHLRPRRARA